jgi:hypothetical protein
VHTGHLKVPTARDTKDAGEVLCIEDCAGSVAGECDMDAHEE